MMTLLLWLADGDCWALDPALAALARLCGGLRLAGVAAESANIPVALATSEEDSIGVPRVPLDPGSADCVLVTGGAYHYGDLVRELGSRGFAADRVLADRAVCLPGFTLGRQRSLRRARLSILSPDCLGGLISNRLGLPFRSPFVNLSCDEDVFLDLMERDPRVSLQGELRFLRTYRIDRQLSYEPPLCELNGHELHMVHYPTFALAKAKWDERLRRVNWYNLLVLMASDRPESLARFDALPFGRKVCFTPLRSDLESAWTVPADLLAIGGYPARKPLSNVVNLMFETVIRTYDLWDLVLHGKRTPLVASA